MSLTQLDYNTAGMLCTILQRHKNSVTTLDMEEVYGTQ